MGNPTLTGSLHPSCCRVEKKISALAFTPTVRKKYSVLPSKLRLGPPIRSRESPLLLIRTNGSGLLHLPSAKLDSNRLYVLPVAVCASKMIVFPSACIVGAYSTCALAIAGFLVLL